VDPIQLRRAEHEMFFSGEHINVSGLAGTPIQVRAVVRGHNGSILMLRNVCVSEERPERMLERVPIQGQVWCEAWLGSKGSLVDIFDLSLGGVCISAPPFVRPGGVVSLADPSRRDRDRVRGLVVGRSGGRSRRGGVVHVAFLAGTSSEAVETLTAGLVECCRELAVQGARGC